jgi:flagellar protein FlbD
VIYVTRLDGSQLVVNADLIETVEHTADTVISLVDGKKLVVTTHVDDIVARVVDYRRRIGTTRPRLRVIKSAGNAQ